MLRRSLDRLIRSFVKILMQNVPSGIRGSSFNRLENFCQRFSS